MPPKPFKPPRPSTTTKKITKPKSTAANKLKDKPASKSTKPKGRTSGSTTFSRPSIASSLALDASDSDEEINDPFATPAPESSREVIDVEMEDSAEEERTENIPEALMSRLLHENYREGGTRMTKDSVVAATRYMEIFVREAIARAEREARTKQDAKGIGFGDVFLEVEDLEKQAPQLLLDF
jgi:hypothetical protein